MRETKPISRRRVMTLAAASAATLALPVAPVANAIAGIRDTSDVTKGGQWDLSPEFDELRTTMEARLADWRWARSRLGAVKARYVRTYREQKRSMGWYFRRPEVAADSAARAQAKVAVERVFMTEAETLADIHLQWRAIDIYEAELGDDIGLARRHFGPVIAAREKEFMT